MKIVLATGWVNDPQKYSQSIPSTSYDFNVSVCLEWDMENHYFSAISRDQDQWYGESFPIDACEWTGKIINATPHDVTVNGVVFPKSGLEIRCSQESIFDREIQGIPVMVTKFGAVENLPPKIEGVFWIVSRIVLTALNGSRPDFLGVGEAIRDDSGRVIGAKNFAWQKGDYCMQKLTEIAVLFLELIKALWRERREIARYMFYDPK